MKENNEDKAGWTWGHIGGVFGGTFQVAVGGTLILCTGGIAGPFGQALISSGFTGVHYSLTAENFDACEYGGKCATSAATSLVFCGVGAAISQVAQSAEIGATVVNVINKNPTTAKLLTESHKIVEGSQYIQMAGKGASIAFEGATQAVEYEVASGLVESAKEKDLRCKRLREKMNVANVGTAAAYGSAGSLISSGIGHFQGKKPKTAGTGDLRSATQGSLRAKDLVYKLKGKVGKQVLKDLGKGIDAALASMTTEIIITASTGYVTNGNKLPSGTQLFISGTRGAVGGGIGSRSYHQYKQYYLSVVKQKAYLKTVIAKLNEINATESPEFNALLKSTLQKKAEAKKEIKAMEPGLGLTKDKIETYKKKQQRAATESAEKELEELERFLGSTSRPQATF